MQAAIEWSAVCLSEYRQLKPLTASTLITLPLFVNTFSYYPKHTHTHPHTHTHTHTSVIVLVLKVKIVKY